MGFIPKSSQWYIAELVIEHAVGDDPRHVVHVNMVLVGASSPEEAYEKATELGKAEEADYLNPKHERVVSRYRGLKDLNVIHDDLEHGAELLYEEKIGVSERALKRLLTPKEKLAVFAPVTPSVGPDYAAADIMNEAEALARQADREK